jgi:hypothetical protein
VRGKLAQDLGKIIEHERVAVPAPQFRTTRSAES